jgi:DNA adenine methylase
MMQQVLFSPSVQYKVRPFTTGLLKWVGNKQRMAHVIASHFPSHFRAFHEPFVGSAAVLGTLAPKQAFASDASKPLIEIWEALMTKPGTLKKWYADRWHIFHQGERGVGYKLIQASYNQSPNGADLLFLCRSCYGGVVRFRKSDGYMSTPCGIHEPILPESFEKRVDEWGYRLRGTQFSRVGYEEAMEAAKPGDLVYCDPPYSDSQSILYGAQKFDLSHLLEVIERCKSRGVHIALSIDGTKKSGDHHVSLPIPDGLFQQELFINCGRSMLRRFQLNGQTLEKELVTDRLLLTYSM